MPLAKRTAAVAAIFGAVLLGGCVNGGDEAYYARECSKQGLTPDGPGWNNCINNERSYLAEERLKQDSIRWGI